MSDSNKYIINLKKLLGTGATARVYLGLNLKDGCQYAIKCSKKNVTGAEKFLIEEMKIVKDLDNKYIIKFYEIIRNFQRFDCVIIMEYCNKGSLYEFAELHQGLCDNMFLKVLECLHHGIRYLRDQIILHRDIKPGNMMVHQDNMGYYHVKIVDLGTAKRVDDNQQFKTICGTPEYLHPDMFIRHIKKLPSFFNTNVDLWSTGVTLYHGAVTQLPFQPLKGIKNPLKYENTLKEMYEKKRPGIISAIQNSNAANDITWSDKLPDKCRMSPMLKDMASELIGHLLDLEETNTYDRFYAEAEQLCKKKRILIFNSLNGELLIVYLDTLTYDSVVDGISKCIGRPKEELIMLTKNKILEPLADETAECLRPMPLKGRLRYELTDDTVLVVLKKLPPQRPPLVSKQISGSDCKRPNDIYYTLTDARSYSEVVMRQIYEVGNICNYIDCQLECYLATMFSFNQYILVDDLRLMHEVLPWRIIALRDSCDVTESLVSIVEETIDSIKNYSDLIGSVESFNTNIEGIRNTGSMCESAIGDYYTQLVEKRTYFKFTNETFYRANDDKASDNLDFLVHLSEEVVNEIKVLPDEKIIEVDNEYKLEIWERHIRLFNHYEVSRLRFTDKSKRISDVHTFCYKLLTSGLQGMENLAAWKAKINNTEDKRLKLTSTFSNIVSRWKKNSSLHMGNTLSLRIMEIKELADQLKNKCFLLDT